VKLILSFLITFYCGIYFSQKELRPYIETKSGSSLEYERVKVNAFSRVIGISNDGVKTKVKSKELKSALVGKSEDYKSFKHRQVVAFSIKGDKLFSMNGTKIEGKRLYEVIMKNGDNMLVSNKVSSGYWSHNYTGANNIGVGGVGPNPTYQSGGSRTQYYFVKGTRVRSLSGLEFFNDEFIAELIESFDNCDGISALLESYKEKKGKLFKIAFLFKDLKKVYLESCFQK
jgi:hypothetical protein